MHIIQPTNLPFKSFSKADEAVEYVKEIYARNTQFIRDAVLKLNKGEAPSGRVRATYPLARVRNTSFQKVDSHLPFGFFCIHQAPIRPHCQILNSSPITSLSNLNCC